MIDLIKSNDEDKSQITSDNLLSLKFDIEYENIELHELPKNVLALLLQKAIERIDYIENIKLNGNEDDQRDIFDLFTDRNFILVELFETAIEEREIMSEE